MMWANNHQTFWSPQALIKNIAAGNLLSSAAILFSGNTFSHIAHAVCSFSEFEVLQSATYYNIQKKYLFPVVNKAWKDERTSVLEQLKGISYSI